jgi:hypothetical protein
MRSLGTRRAFRVAGAATVAVIALAGCSAGQVAETAVLKTPVSGLSTESPDGSLLIRNLQVTYNSPTGYPAGAAAPLEVALFNKSKDSITVAISSKPGGSDGQVSAQQVGVVGSASASASASAAAPSPSAAGSASPSTSPSALVTPAAGPARFTMPPLSSLTFQAGDKQQLQAIGLSGKLFPGASLSLVFEVSTTDKPIEVQAPFAVPTSPAPRGEPVENENAEE